MACKQVGALLVVVVTVGLGWIASATEFVVGGDDGWKLGVDYTAWAKDKAFKVGDSLVFKYKAPAHDVVRADSPNFDACTVPDGNQPLATGNDSIPLKTPGEKWYLCSKGNHCAQGMKLAIKVVENSTVEAPTAAPPTPASSSTRVATFYYPNLMAVAVAVAIMI